MEPESRPALVVSLAPDFKRAELWSLVLLSVNISHRIIQTTAGWEILVEEVDIEAARWHIKSFEDENINWPPPKEKAIKSGNPGPLTFIFLMIMMLFYKKTGPWSTDVFWFKKGAVSSSRIFYGGEWWRVVTGLTLHADIVHLLGNVCLGFFMINYLALEVGAGSAWLLALFSGAIGNYINAFFHHGGHLSIGFSTSVFGVIGCLCGLRVANRSTGLKGVLLPLGAGGGLLAMLGTEGERTDLGAHLWGLAVGMLCGFLWFKLSPREKGLKSLTAGFWGQIFAVLLCVIFVGWAWYAAFVYN